MPLGGGVSRDSGAPVVAEPRRRAVQVVAVVVLALALVNWLAGWLPVLLIVVILATVTALRVGEADLAWHRYRAWRARKSLATMTGRGEAGR